jgi:hypothetical protein
MIVKQVIKIADGVGFEIDSADWTAPVPEAGDLVHWAVDGKTYSAQVRSRSFFYDNSEVSMARTNDWGVTITIHAEIVEAAQAPHETAGRKADVVSI